MKTNIELRKTPTKGRREGYGHQERTQQVGLHVSPSQPASDKTNEEPAHGMAAGIAKGYRGVFINSQWRGSAVVFICNTLWRGRRSFPPHPQGYHDFHRTRLPPYLRTGQRIHANLRIGRYSLGKVLLAYIFCT